MAKTATARKASTKTAAKTAKKPAAKKTAVKSSAKAAPKTTASKAKSYKEPLTKTQLLQTVAEDTGVAKKDVAAVFDSFADVINGHVHPKGAGKINLLGLMTIEVRTKPATKARKGTNPFTGEEMMFKAKPARKVVKIKALKKLKEAAE